MKGSDNLHILHVISGLGRGGAERTLVNLAIGLNRGPFKSTVVSLAGSGDFASELVGKGIDVHDLGFPIAVLPLRGLLRLVRLLRSEGPDVLQTWMYHADVVGLVAAKLAHNPPVVWNIRGSGRSRSEMGIRTWLVGKAAAALSAHPAAVVVNSEQGRLDHSSMGYQPVRWEVIHNGVDTETFRPRKDARAMILHLLGLTDPVLIAGNMARFHPMKGHRMLIRAMDKLLETNHRMHLVLIGKGVTSESAHLATWRSQSRAAERIHMVGPQSNPEYWLAALDFHILASSGGEGFPNAVAESMACGVPNVVTDVGEASSIVGSTGIVVQAGASGALAEGISSMLSLGRPARAERGRAARERIVERFSLAKMVSSYALLYRDLVG